MRLESETCSLLLHLFPRLFPPSATLTINYTRESLKEREEKRERQSTNTITNKIPKREPMTLNGKRAQMHNTFVGLVVYYERKGNILWNVRVSFA